MKLLKFLRSIKQSFSHYTPSVQILISKPNLLHNLHEYQRRYPGLSFAPVLKSNAYGHGLIQIAQILDNQNISFFVVDSLYETMLLRNEDIKSEILVIGYTSPQNINQSKLSKVAFTITNLEQLQKISKIISSPKKFHLKIDTGMHRQGLLPNQIDPALKIIKSHKFLILEGLCSHFADADGPQTDFTKSQVKSWNLISSRFKHQFPNLKFLHLSNTAGSHFSSIIDSNVSRLGLGLYGINPSPSVTNLKLKPVLQMKSIISSIKTIASGEFVGYNITYKTKRPTKIATVPLGYFEGIDRRLSNHGFLKIKNHFCSIIGRVSMNITTIDITTIPYLKLGTPVTIISDNRKDKNSIENIAKLAHTIPYEILVHLPQHLRRTIV